MLNDKFYSRLGDVVVWLMDHVERNIRVYVAVIATVLLMKGCA